MKEDSRIWKIDPDHSTVAFTVKHMMFATVHGRFRRFRGSLMVDEKAPERSFVEVDIEAASIDTGSEDRDRHLRSGDFLNVEEHPTITFRSTRVRGAHAEAGDDFQVVGDLTLRGRRLEVELDSVFEGVGRDPEGQIRAAFQARVELDRREFGLMWNRALESGGVLVANKVRIELDVQAVKLTVAREDAA